MLKRLCGLAVLGLLAVPGAWGFSLLGPSVAGSVDALYQQPVIAYNLPGDIGAPKNLGEEYRHNMPIQYYSYEDTFLTYFGSNGVYAIDQAFAIMNSLSNASAYSRDLTEFPLEARRFNYQAQALSLADLKSVALSAIVEQMGLAEPDRWTWCLHDREPGDNCPVTCLYTVIKRNFDPVPSPTDVLQPSSYVNGTLYSYFIVEFCTGGDPLADAIEFPVDPLASTFTAVAAGGLFDGSFYTGLTRDDMGGLRYLWRTNNMNIESTGPGTVSFITNNNTHQLLVSSNLALLVARSLTNDAATLSGLYPDLAIIGTSDFFTNVVATNVFSYFTNFPWSPAGSAATLVFSTNFTTNILTYYRHTFGNVITNTYYTNGTITLLQTSVGSCGAYAPPNSICTNITGQTMQIPMIAGDFFLVPSNGCGYSVVSTQLIRVQTDTNLLLQATNTAGSTNFQQFSQDVINYFTNYILDIHLVVCPSNTVALRQGMEKVTFVRRDFDSLLNRFFYPITNEYTTYIITNNTIFPQRVSRVVTLPDYLINADDLAEANPGNNLIGAAAIARTVPTYNTSFINPTLTPGLSGPGTIEPFFSFTFNKVGPIYLNTASSEANQGTLLIWGSFDGSTNTPIVYPNGTDIENLEHQVLIQIHPPPPLLPGGQVNAGYTNFSGFTATGGLQPPATWSLTPTSPGLPYGLTLNSNGTITGIATAAGIYDFVVRMTDATGRFVDTPYSITIGP